MGTSPYALWNQASTVLLPPSSFSLRAWRGMTQGRSKEGLVENSWIMVTKWLSCFLVILGAPQVSLEITGLVPRTAQGGSVETQHNSHGVGYILSMVAHDLDILGSYWCFVVNWVSCWIRKRVNTVEHLKKASMMNGTHTHMADEMELSDSQMAGHSYSQFHNYYLIMLHQHPPVVLEPHYPPSWAMITVFSGDPFIDMLCQQSIGLD